MNRPLESDFDALARSLPARVGVAIAGVETISLGDWTTGVAWSTVKVPLAIAASRADCASPDQLRAAIIHSDNAAAEELWSQLGDSAAQRVQSVIRDAGDPATMVESRRLRTEFTPSARRSGRWPIRRSSRPDWSRSPVHPRSST